MRDQNRRRLTDKKVDKAADHKNPSDAHGGEKKVEDSADQNPKQDEKPETKDSSKKKLTHQQGKRQHSKGDAKHEGGNSNGGADTSKKGDADKQNAGDGSHQSKPDTQHEDAGKQDGVDKQKTVDSSHKRQHGKVGAKHPSDAGKQSTTDEDKKKDDTNEQNGAGQQSADTHPAKGKKKKHRR